MIDIQNDEDLNYLRDRLQEPSNQNAAELLKEASIDAEFDDIISEAFADQENRAFPIYSPEMAVMSALYMQGQDVDPLVKEACAEALQEWGIDNVSTSQLSKEASHNSIPDEYFLLPESKKLPVVDEASLSKSASVLVGSLSTLDIAERVEASTNLYKMATEQYGVSRDSINVDIIRYAQEAPCDLNKLAMSVSERFAETHQDNYKGMISKIASLKSEIGGSVSFDKSINAGIAYDLFMLDKEAGVESVFDAVYDTFNSPYVEQINEDLTKSASENSIVIGRHSVLESTLYKVAEEDIDSAFPGLSQSLFEDGVMSVEKVENFTKEMPASAIDALGGYLASA